MIGVVALFSISCAAILFMLRFIFALEAEIELARECPKARFESLSRYRAEPTSRGNAPTLTLVHSNYLRPGGYESRAPQGAFVQRAEGSQLRRA